MKHRGKRIVIAALLLALLCGCGAAPQKEHETEPAGDGPYLSITYGCNNAENAFGRDMVFYTYDLETRQLTEEAVIPFDARYASGVVSRADGIVYYSRRAEPGVLTSNDSLCAHDIATGEETLLETEHVSYNEITLVDPDTLLVMAVTAEHPILPARFDLKSRTFTDAAEVNGEEPTLYTSGSSPLNYNYQTGSFINIYQVEAERYSEAYHRFESEINTYVALMNDDLVKDPNRVYAVSLLLGSLIDDAVQLSDNELLVERTDDSFDEEKGVLVTERHFYRLTFAGDGSASFEPTEPPFPAKKVREHGYRIVDGGRTWYLIMGEKNSETGGLYAYCTETGELTPILLNDPAAEGYIIDFSIIGPQGQRD